MDLFSTIDKVWKGYLPADPNRVIWLVLHSNVRHKENLAKTICQLFISAG